MTNKKTDDELEKLAPKPVKEPVTTKVPIDRATGKPYKSGEIPPGWNEPVP
jgi:hypothetical protein